MVIIKIYSYPKVLPTVECLKGRRDQVGPSLEYTLGGHTYIGRNMNMGGWRLPKSKWSNPFSVKQYGRDEAIALYRNYILSTSELFYSLVELTGKILLCWCKPEPCHGDVLIELYSQCVH